MGIIPTSIQLIDDLRTLKSTLYFPVLERILVFRPCHEPYPSNLTILPFSLM